MAKLYGVGIKDGPVLRNRDSYYRWKCILRRCYSDTQQNVYVGCTVCRAWLHFSKFHRWYTRNYVEGYHIDKDILKPGNKVYCPQYCRFVPKELNLLLNKNEAQRGRFSQGISRTATGNYQSTLSKNGKNFSLGTFTSKTKAAKVYRKAKAAWIRTIARKYYLAGAIDEAIYSALLHRSYINEF